MISMKTSPAKVILMLIAIACAVSVSAVEPALSKDAFTLFHPTPWELLRELSTDRPDKTECPFTVDAGHLQVELDWAVYARDHDTHAGADRGETSWTIAPVNLKVGLNNWSDLQFVLEPLVIVDVTDRSAGPVQRERSSSFGDVTVRYKANLWGNDGGPSAFGVMPFVKLPVHGHGIGANATEGGIILPYSHDLAHGFGLGMQTEVDFIKNADGHRYHSEFVNSVTVGHTLLGKLEGYAEFFSQHSAESGARWVGTLDFGITYGVTPDIQLDAGMNVGISPAAPDIEIFTGISRRF